MAAQRSKGGWSNHPARQPCLGFLILVLLALVYYHSRRQSSYSLTAARPASLEATSASPSAGKKKNSCTESTPDRLNWNGGCFRSLADAAPRHTVDLSGNELNSLPKGFATWADGKVHSLFLSDNQFDTIPPEIAELFSVRMLSLRRNRITVLDCDALPPSIYHLILTDNQITEFRGDCQTRLSGLNKLMMARNKLEVFPDHLRFPHLELIRLPQNRIRELPRNLLRLSPKLKWVSLAENPCCPEPPELQLEHVADFKCSGARELGGGTSGTALLCTDSGLVFKRFKPNSSDGSSRAELLISALLPKDDPVILAPLYTATIAGDSGVVFPFKDAQAIGLPPQFGSDDRFPPEKQGRFSARRVLEAVRQGACALARMHEAGVVHMDLYAHNSLLSEREFVFLDFGAATCVKFLPKEDAALFIALDVRAFGTLVSNLMDYVVADKDTDMRSMRELETIRKRASAGIHSRLLCALYKPV